jgi:hypothetical protein
MNGADNGMELVGGNRGRPVIALITLDEFLLPQRPMVLYETNVLGPDYPFRHPTQFNTEEVCHICKYKTPIVYGDCGHISLCIHCARMYLLKTCPICRAEIEYMKSLPFILNL